MKKETNRAIKVGFLATAALLLFVIAIYFIGSKNNLFRSQISVTCSFKDIRGVVVGNNVRFSGINVGNVKDIYLQSDTSVVLKLSIREDYAKYIYRNSIVEIGQDGLMGNKLILVSGGTPNSGRIEESDQLRAKYGIDIENMLSQTRDILVEAKDAMANLNSVTLDIKNGNGDIGELLTKKTLTTKIAITADRLNNTLANVTAITQKINSGQGDLGKLVNGNDITNQAKTIMVNLAETSKKAENAVGELQTTASNINNGQGTLSLLLNNKKTANNVDTTIIKVNYGLDQLSKTAKAIEDSWIVNLFSKKNKKTKKTTLVVPQSSATKEIVVPANVDTVKIIR